MSILKTQDELQKHDHRTGGSFECGQCHNIIPLITGGCGTGYGYAETSHTAKPICYACCGENDRKQMVANGRITLYVTVPNICEKAGYQCYFVPLTEGKVSNWPATLEFQIAHIKRSWGYGFGRQFPVYHVWFRGPDGHVWYGRNAGYSNQLLACQRTKEVY
jgi:hypothetical protein